MTASYGMALQAAQAAASDQLYPKGCLYIVATPIGNLADISLRALHILNLADVIACEDTRHTRQLLQAYGIDKNPSQLLPLHQHNEHSAAEKLIALLKDGLRIAYVSDAGTPGISDPGAILVAAAQQSALRVMPIPGASSVTTALSATALANQPDSLQSQYTFWGFLPSKGKARSKVLQNLQNQTSASVILEAPHRILNLAKDLQNFDQRNVTLAKELTKQHEHIITLPAQQLIDWLSADAQRQRGEFILILHAQKEITSSEEGIPTSTRTLLDLLLQEPSLSLKSAVAIASSYSGIARKSIYELALERQQKLNH